jgi:hypothetical protein
MFCINSTVNIILLLKRNEGHISEMSVLILSNILTLSKDRTFLSPYGDYVMSRWRSLSSLFTYLQLQTMTKMLMC